jgi:hypothetical protein
LARGDTDAALLHAVRAAHARLAGLQDSGALEPSFSWKSLQGLASMNPTARLLQLAEEVAQNVTRSSPGSGVTVPLAHALVPLVGSLVHRPPIDELRVHFTDTFLTIASTDET